VVVDATVTTVVVGAVVVEARVVVGRGTRVDGGAAVGTGRVVGGALAEVRGAEVAGTCSAAVEVVVLASTTVVSGVPRFPTPAAAATVVDTGQAPPPHGGGAAGSPNARRVNSTTIPTVATAVDLQGRRRGESPRRAVGRAVDDAATRSRRWATLPVGGPGTGPGG
jgi:hypothetical protein